MKTILIILGWSTCGVVSYGWMFHYFQERFKCFAYPHRWLHRLPAFLAAVMGPVGFLARLLIATGDRNATPWRLRYRAIKPNESWNDFHARWPGLSKAQWQALDF